MGIVFERFGPPSTATGGVPLIRGFATSSVNGAVAIDGAARGFIPQLRGLAVGAAEYPGMAGGGLPRLRGVGYSRRGNYALGLIPPLNAVSWQTIGFDVGSAFQYSGIPLLRAAGHAIAEYPAVQTDNAGVPRLRGVARSQGTWYGLGFIPRLTGYGYEPYEATNYFLIGQSPGVMKVNATAVPVISLNDVLRITAGSKPRWIHVLREALQVADDPRALFNAIRALRDRALFNDGLQAFLRAARTDGVALSDAPTAWIGLALALHDVLRVGARPTAAYDARVAIAVAFALRDMADSAQRGYRQDTVNLADELAARVNAYVSLLDAWCVEATLAKSAILHALLSDRLVLSDSQDYYLAIRQALRDGAQFGVALYTSEDTYVAWVMTPATRAMRRYTNFDFNSFGELNGRLCGANKNGLYWLDGETDDGTEIRAALRTGLLDFGTRQLKRMDRMYLGYTSDGTLGLRVITTSETGDKTAYTYKMVRRDAAAPREQRIPIGRGMRSVYWQFELVNAAGSDFELHDVTVLPMLLSRRIS